MDVSNLNFSLGNIVMLYENLKDAKISRDKILGLFSDPSEHFDIGQLFMVKFPAKNMEIYLFLDEGRVETKIVSPKDDDWIEIAKTASQIFGSIEGARMKAFGFNYYVEIPMQNDQNAGEFLVEKFRPSSDILEKQLDGKLLSFSTTVRYSKNDELYQLTVSPKRSDTAVLNIQLNVQYDISELFNTDQLIENYVHHKSDFEITIPKLLE